MSAAAVSVPARRVASTVSFSLEFLECDLQRAHAAQFDLSHDELILASPHLIDRDVALQDGSLLPRPPQQRARFAGSIKRKQTTIQLRACVFEREINVAGRLRAEIADLARPPRPRRRRLLQQPSDLRCQIADGQYLPDLLQSASTIRRNSYCDLDLLMPVSCERRKTLEIKLAERGGFEPHITACLFQK